MTHAERLKEIECSQHEREREMPDYYEEINWLIARVKKLTKALEFYEDESTYENWYIHGSVLYEEKAEIARKALEDE